MRKESYIIQISLGFILLSVKLFTSFNIWYIFIIPFFVLPIMLLGITIYYTYLKRTL